MTREVGRRGFLNSFCSLQAGQTLLFAMSFPKAPLRRFNEAPTCAPSPGAYDVKTSDPSKGPVSFDKSQRFKEHMEDAGIQQNVTSMKPSSTASRKLDSKNLKPNSAGMKAGRDLASKKDLKTCKELEKEIRVLIGERGQQDKRLQALEEELAKSESKLSAAIREKTSLLANIASLEKQQLELIRTNELLKSKFHEDGTRKNTRLWIEVMKLRNLRNAKKTGPVKQEDTETKQHKVQKDLVQSQEKVAQLEEQLTASERQAEETCDLENLLEYIAELANASEQVDKYKLDVIQLETIIEAKNKDIDTLQNTHETKEATLSTEIEELHERCKLLEQQKEKCLIEYGEKEKTANAEIDLLKEKLIQEEQERQKQKEAYNVAFANLSQGLERELRETMAELERLHAKDDQVEMVVKHLENVKESQAEKLAALEAELRGYKAFVVQEITSLKQEKTALQDRLLEMSKTVQHVTQKMEDAQLAKEMAQEENARMILDAQTKVALKDAQIKRIKESSIVEIANLQAKLEEQSESFKKQLEIERRTVAEKVEADCRESLETWRTQYEDLLNKVKPFQKQLDAYEAEKNALLNENGAAQEELNKLSDAYAKLLGHQNQKQKIKHVVKLKEENAQLKQEVLKLRSQVAKEKKVRGELEDQLNAIQGIKRFDPSKAFQHSAKENVSPKTPFKESNKQNPALFLSNRP
ncbi:hyaluronan mediated motility receptor isoform X4 [Podarcis muralis]